jgi:hypothetical protein
MGDVGIALWDLLSMEPMGVFPPMVAVRLVFFSPDLLGLPPFFFLSSLEEEEEES